jgi:hypothetical protein
VNQAVVDMDCYDRVSKTVPKCDTSRTERKNSLLVLFSGLRKILHVNILLLLRIAIFGDGFENGGHGSWMWWSIDGFKVFVLMLVLMVEPGGDELEYFSPKICFGGTKKFGSAVWIRFLRRLGALMGTSVRTEASTKTCQMHDTTTLTANCYLSSLRKKSRIV